MKVRARKLQVAAAELEKQRATSSQGRAEVADLEQRLEVTRSQVQSERAETEARIAKLEQALRDAELATSEAERKAWDTMKEMVKEDQRDTKISELTQQLVAECRRRAETDTFYGFMNYVSILATKE